MKAIYLKTIKGYTALARFLSDVPTEMLEIEKSKIEGLPESRYVSSPTVMVETKGKMKIVRVETYSGNYKIFQVV